MWSDRLSVFREMGIVGLWALIPSSTQYLIGNLQNSIPITQPSALIRVHINPEARVKAEQGEEIPALMQGVWRSFRVRFENEAKVTAVPRIHSPNAPRSRDRHHWLEMRLEPVGKPLTGTRVEYRTLWLRSRDSGKREATFTFDVGQGTQDLGFRGAVAILFPCAPNSKDGKKP